MQKKDVSLGMQLEGKWLFVFAPVGNAVLSVPSEKFDLDGRIFLHFYAMLRCKIVPLRGRNAEDSVPYGCGDYRALNNNLS